MLVSRSYFVYLLGHVARNRCAKGEAKAAAVFQVLQIDPTFVKGDLDYMKIDLFAGSRLRITNRGLTGALFMGQVHVLSSRILPQANCNVLPFYNPVFSVLDDVLFRQYSCYASVRVFKTLVDQNCAGCNSMDKLHIRVRAKSELCVLIIVVIRKQLFIPVHPASVVVYLPATTPARHKAGANGSASI